jgi:uncharacterized membrane protein YedE/YeeE
MMDKIEKLFGIIGGIAFLCLGLWFESIYTGSNSDYVGFLLVLIIAVVATIFSLRWKPHRKDLKK